MASDGLLEKIISGGQTGADLAALEVAEELGIKTGGWAAPGFMTVEGGKKSLLEVRFGLEEIETESPVSGAYGYVLRSMKNVDEADATIAFRIAASVGTDKTIGYCHTKRWGYKDPCIKESQYKPILIISDSVHKIFSDGSLQLHFPPLTWVEDARRVREFLMKHNVKVLNVCGHRQSDQDPTWQSRVYNFLLFCLRAYFTNEMLKKN